VTDVLEVRTAAIVIATMEAVSTSKISATLYEMTLRNIAEDSRLLTVVGWLVHRVIPPSEGFELYLGDAEHWHVWMIEGMWEEVIVAYCNILFKE
jgi:hypothetical protein